MSSLLLLPLRRRCLRLEPPLLRLRDRFRDRLRDLLWLRRRGFRLRGDLDLLLEREDDEDDEDEEERLRLLFFATFFFWG